MSWSVSSANFPALCSKSTYIRPELSDAFDERISRPEYRWLAKWTAHADLTLTINDNAGISPSGSYIRYQGNAVNQAAGPSAFPATAARTVVNQFLTVSAGVTLSSEAVRTETLSFTVALSDLRDWRKQVNQRKAGYPLEDRTCNFPPSTGVTGNLGLKEWVESAIYPVDIAQLKAGIHSGTAAKTTAPTAPQAGKTTPLSSPLTVGELKDNLIKWDNFWLKVETENLRVTATDDMKKALQATRTSLQSALYEKKDFELILETSLERRYIEAMRAYHEGTRHEAVCIDEKTIFEAELKKARDDFKKLDDTLVGHTDRKERVDYIDAASGNTTLSDTYRALADIIYKYGYRDERVFHGLVAFLKHCDKINKAVTNLGNFLPKQPDPPIDSLLHSVTFVVSYGANLTPSWTLLQWKGPGQTPNLLAASGVRTHGLVIAIGPPAAAPSVGPDAIRLIQNQAIRSINLQQ
jgi:hypothetical protein